jgi:hypothetical protein
VSQAAWFREALETYFQLMQAPPSEMGALHAAYQNLLAQAADTAKVERELMHGVIIERSLPYRHARLEGFSPEQAFEIAAPKPG